MLIYKNLIFSGTTCSDFINSNIIDKEKSKKYSI